jgi:DNA polymerase III subunit delta'
MPWNQIGHQWSANLLLRHIQEGVLRHAYLITGAPGLGRKNLAVQFMMALNCANKPEPGIACGKCSTCQRIARLEHPDIFPVESEENSSTIKIDQIRRLIHNLSLVPYEAPYRIGYLLDFDQANQESQNALLKTLEEPGEQVILIIIAQSGDQLLETITSRCEEVHLRPLPITTVKTGLQEKYGIPEIEADQLAHISGGRPETAFDFYRNPELMETRSRILGDLQDMLQSSRVAKMKFAAEIEKKPHYITELLKHWNSFWHDVLLKAGGSRAPIQNIDHQKSVERIAEQLDLTQVHKVLSSLENAEVLLSQNANTRLTLENLLLHIPTIR